MNASGTSNRPTLLGVWAHPDDESYLSAALMRRVVRAGGRVTVVVATRGEQGSADPGVDHEAFGRHRERELRAAMRELGVTDVRVLGFPDGACDQVEASGPVDHIRSLITELRPNLVTTFGPDGITGHPDHVAVSHWVTAAWAELRRSGDALPFSSQLLYATMTEAFVERHHRQYPELPLTLVGEPHPTPASDIVVEIEPDAGERRKKRSALDAHASQTRVLQELLGRARFHDWWQTESFRHPTADEAAAALRSGRLTAAAGSA